MLLKSRYRKPGVRPTASGCWQRQLAKQKWQGWWWTIRFPVRLVSTEPALSRRNLPRGVRPQSEILTAKPIRIDDLAAVWGVGGFDRNRE
jgi:hypothetical protein